VGHLRYYLGFLSGKEKIEDFSYMMRENPLERKFVESLIEWKEEEKQKPSGTDEVMRKTKRVSMRLDKLAEDDFEKLFWQEDEEIQDTRIFFGEAIHIK
jgi:hypothetical protein